MVTLNDTLTKAITEGYYLNTNADPPKIVKFMEYGSQCCIAAIFDENGKLLDSRVSLRLDSDDKREGYELIPYDQLPKPIKTIIEITQTSPKYMGPVFRSDDISDAALDCLAEMRGKDKIQ